VKPIDVDLEDRGLYETDSSELSASTASNTMLPQLVAIDAEKAQNEEERKLKREARRKSREARKKKKEEEKATNASSSDISSSSEDGDDDDSYQVSKGARRAKPTPTTNMPPYPLTTPLCL
jgi:hypothetical protein